jgi:hypothetical protein
MQYIMSLIVIMKGGASSGQVKSHRRAAEPCPDFCRGLISLFLYPTIQIGIKIQASAGLGDPEYLTADFDQAPE